MLLQEPDRSPYDVNFHLFGIPVRIHPFFWVVTFVLGMPTRFSEPFSFPDLLTWMAVCLVSIVVHELGHAVVIRHFGWSPHIVLYGMGGLAVYQPSFTAMPSSYRRRGNSVGGQILISFAGPAAGLLLATLIIVALYASNRSIPFWPVPVGRGPYIQDYRLALFLFYLLQVNLFWSLINLLPVYPLDGGKICRELLLFFNPQDGHRQALLVSVVAGGGAALFALVRLDSFFMALLFGYLAFSSYQMSQGIGGGFGRRGPW